jgi:hypothetical protein
MLRRTEALISAPDRRNHFLPQYAAEPHIRYLEAPGVCRGRCMPASPLVYESGGRSSNPFGRAIPNRPRMRAAVSAALPVAKLLDGHSYRDLSAEPVRVFGCGFSTISSSLYGRRLRARDRQGRGRVGLQAFSHQRADEVQRINRRDL